MDEAPERSLLEVELYKLYPMYADVHNSDAIIASYHVTFLRRYYGATIFKQAGFDTNKEATLAQMVLGIVKVIATIISLAKVDKLGRRKLLLWGTAVMFFSLIVLASVTAAFPPFINASDIGEELADAEGRRMRRSLLSAQHHRHSDHSVETPKSIRWVSMVSLLTFVVAYAFSYGQ